MTESQAALTAAGCIAVVMVVMLGFAIRWRRRLLARLHAAVVRLDRDAVRVDDRGLERALVALERAVEDQLLRGGDASTSEVRLGQALNAIESGVIVFDEHSEIVYRNGAAAIFADARHSEALVEAAITEMRDATIEGRTANRTLELFGPPRRTLVLNATPLDDGRRSIGSLVVIDDVTERRRLDAVRRDFVSNISHELKTPVGGLGLLAETLVSEDEPAVIRRLAKRMLDEAFRVSHTIDDLLELSRIEAEEARIRDPVSVSLVIAEAVERLRASAERRQIVIDAEEPAARMAVLGDRRQLTSALSNLLDNAIKYSDDGETVHVRAKSDGTTVEIAVADHGIGIPRRDAERIFERFYRVDRARSRETGGTGLGLAIVRHVASNHNGEIVVDSREGEGSIFTLRLPAGPGPVALTTEAV